jgi:hypothetical protein
MYCMHCVSSLKLAATCFYISINKTAKRWYVPTSICVGSFYNLTPHKQYNQPSVLLDPTIFVSLVSFRTMETAREASRRRGTDGGAFLWGAKQAAYCAIMAVGARPDRFIPHPIKCSGLLGAIDESRVAHRRRAGFVSPAPTHRRETHSTLLF